MRVRGDQRLVEQVKAVHGPRPWSETFPVWSYGYVGTALEIVRENGYKVNWSFHESVEILPAMAEVITFL